jgi:uncharacterized membrane protein (DUF485 family)
MKMNKQAIQKDKTPALFSEIGFWLTLVAFSLAWWVIVWLIMEVGVAHWQRWFAWLGDHRATGIIVGTGIAMGIGLIVSVHRWNRDTKDEYQSY